MWHNKRRTSLVVLSIAVGVFAVGTVAHMRTLVQSDMLGSYEDAVPASATIYTEQPFDEDLVEIVRDIPGVAAAEGRRSVMVRFQTDEQSGWYPLLIVARPDYEDTRINILQPEPEFGPDPEPWPGPVAMPPPERELILERVSVLTPNLGLASKVRLGDMLLVETPTGKQREVRIAGLVADFTQVPATFYNRAYGFVSVDTMEWLGLPRTLNELAILVSGDRRDETYITQVADTVADRLERGGVSVLRTDVPTPGKLPLSYVVDGLVFLLSAMGILSLLSSVFLLINTVQALLAQQVQQIGMMKALGAHGRQIMGMYVSTIVIYGLLAVAIAMPLGKVISDAAGSQFLGAPLSYTYSAGGVVIWLVLAILIAVAASYLPAQNAARITVREVLAYDG